MFIRQAPPAQVPPWTGVGLFQLLLLEAEVHVRLEELSQLQALTKACIVPVGNGDMAYATVQIVAMSIE